MTENRSTWHRCRRWTIRGLHCPYGGRAVPEPDGPGGPDGEDDGIEWPKVSPPAKQPPRKVKEIPDADPEPLPDWVPHTLDLPEPGPWPSLPWPIHPPGLRPPPPPAVPATVPAPLPNPRPVPIPTPVAEAFKATDRAARAIPRVWRPTDDQLRGLFPIDPRKGQVPGVRYGHALSDVRLATAENAVAETAQEQKVPWWAHAAAGAAGTAAGAAARGFGGGFHFQLMKRIGAMTAPGVRSHSQNFAGQQSRDPL